MNIDLVCPICLDDIESIEHLFHDCQMVKKVWELADKHKWFPIQSSPRGYQEITDPIKRAKDSRNPKLLQKFSFLVWSIWKGINAIVFEKKFFNPIGCLIRAKQDDAEWRIRTCMSVDFNQKGPSSSPSTSFHLVRWNTSPPGFVKINFDGSLLNSSAAGGYILWDWMGKLLKVGADYYGHTSILVTKGWALRDGISAAIQAGFSKLYIEGDNLIVIQALTGKSIVPWKIGTIIDDIRRWLQQATQFWVTHIFWEVNMAADWLSKTLFGKISGSSSG